MAFMFLEIGLAKMWSGGSSVDQLIHFHFLARIASSQFCSVSCYLPSWRGIIFRSWWLKVTTTTTEMLGQVGPDEEHDGVFDGVPVDGAMGFHHPGCVIAIFTWMCEIHFYLAV